MLLKVKAISGWIWKRIRPQVMFLLTEGGKALAVAALAVVKELMANPDMTSAQKRETAVEVLKTQMTQQGYNIAERFIRQEIENAVDVVKSTEE